MANESTRIHSSQENQKKVPRSLSENYHATYSRMSFIQSWQNMDRKWILLLIYILIW